MKQPDVPLKERLRVIRNLTVSAYGSLLNGGTLKSEISDELVAQRLNSMVFKIKSRFDSFKVLIQTLPDGSRSDGAVALAESVIAHASMVHALLVSAGFGERAQPYAEACTPHLVQFSAASAGRAITSDAEILKNSMRLPSQLKHHAPDAVVYYFCASAAKEFGSGIHLTGSDGLARIVREITFPPEYQQAGLSILNYFSAVLNDKYPNIPVTVSIRQQPEKVTLVITLPDGTQDTVSKTLSDYGLVVTGQMTPNEFAGDDLKALALQQKLELAQMEVRQTRELLRIQDQYANRRVESLETEVKNLYTLLGREFTLREALQVGLLNLVGQMTPGHVGGQAAILVQSLATAIAERNVDRTRVISEDIQSNEPALFSRLNEFFLKAATSGVIGNSVYDWLKIIWPVLPK